MKNNMAFVVGSLLSRNYNNVEERPVLDEWCGRKKVRIVKTAIGVRRRRSLSIWDRTAAVTTSSQHKQQRRKPQILLCTRKEEEPVGSACVPIGTEQISSKTLSLNTSKTAAMGANDGSLEPMPTKPTLAPALNTNGTLPVSVLLLNVVAILWGTQHAVIKTVVDSSNNPATFTLLRFGLAALLASPNTPGLSKILPAWNVKDTAITTIDDERKVVASSDKITKAWRWGMEMGIWMFLGFGFQAVGLQFTTAQRSGFLLYLNVKFVPFFARILLGRDISTVTWASAFIAFTGTALLAYNGDSLFALNVGDLWTIAAAAASAMFILRLECASAEVTDAAGLSAACLWVVTLLSVIWTVVAQFSFAAAAAPMEMWWFDICTIAVQHPLELIYLGGVTTALANWIQTKAQRDVTAERASVIYAMDPVYGAVFSYLLLGETLNGPQGWLGAVLITLAAATNAFLDASRTAAVDKNLAVNGGAKGDRDDTLTR